MFTGIIECTGSLHALNPTQTGSELLIDAGGWGVGFAPGESISVSGCCLTLAPRPGTASGLLRFDVVPETLSKTTLGFIGPGTRVNLERAATAATLMGGHVVQGHVEGVGIVRGVKEVGEWRVTIEAPSELLPCITPKGSVAVEGVSLTIASVDVAASSFDVALIPTTLDLTTLRDLRVGSRVNIETDILARTVVHFMRHFTDR
ncbi:MAG: riboflavin synthase [Phycisphaeraceae bacterium]|nr:riboflavin synthase [Phycisphaeraceae bacterium]QYK48597.1 MAG: riboflavin synthase [Phycisphaeraceae bacterium]